MKRKIDVNDVVDKNVMSSDEYYISYAKYRIKFIYEECESEYRLASAGLKLLWDHLGKEIEDKYIEFKIGGLNEYYIFRGKRYLVENNTYATKLKMMTL